LALLFALRGEDYTAALPAALQQPLVMRALEERTLLTQTDLERERYEARRKAQLDYNTGLKVARMEGHMEGRAEGRAEGEKIGIIHQCERLLKRQQTPTEQLVSLSLDDLTRLAEELHNQVLQQR
jgi:flagellar biosynthesis/type III secretory pathway protein FliH